MSPLVFWPSVLGLAVFAAGFFTYRRDLFAPDSGRRLFALGVILIASALATFSGEHFTAARDIARIVPKWLPGPLFITYFVGVGLLSAAVSFVARKCVRWSAPLLALMFALFVLTMDLPAAIKHFRMHLFWIFPFREGVFALGAFSVFVYNEQLSRRRRFRGFAPAAALFVAIMLIFFGAQNILHPEFSPGVPDNRPTSAWVPAPLLVAYLIGAVLVVLGVATLIKNTAVPAITWTGIFMTLLTLVLYVPDLFLSRGVQPMVTAINFVQDTLLFAGTMFAIARAIEFSPPR